MWSSCFFLLFDLLCLRQCLCTYGGNCPCTPNCIEYTLTHTPSPPPPPTALYLFLLGTSKNKHSCESRWAQRCDNGCSLFIRYIAFSFLRTTTLCGFLYSMYSRTIVTGMRGCNFSVICVYVNCTCLFLSVNGTKYYLICDEPQTPEKGLISSIRPYPLTRN